MTGEGFWAFTGVVAALLGLALLVGAARQRRGTRDQD
jgi:hypothetical protein